MAAPRAVLGLSAHFHDSAAAMVVGEEVLAAAQEERFSRIRHDRAFPRAAVDYCLEEAGRSLADLDAVAYYERPDLKARRVAATWWMTAPRGIRTFRRTAADWWGWKRDVGAIVEAGLGRSRGELPPVVAVSHHESHAASAYLPSPFEDAAVVCVDGVGEWATTTIWHGRSGRLRPVAVQDFPHSLGLLYSAFTHFCGFRVDSGEYKLMGLAPYGVPRYAGLIRERLIDLRPDGSFRLDVRRFDFPFGERMTGPAFAAALGVGEPRLPESPLTERECDLAASVQQVLEEAMVAIARTAVRLTGERRLCLAGGVALNCVANAAVLAAGDVQELWVQPAAGDAGGALGAALLVAGPEADRTGARDRMRGALLGPDHDAEVPSFVASRALPARACGEELFDVVADALAAGQVVGWSRGRMEFGPRALGSRSILADPRRADMQRLVNLKVKFRESFRPFAPAVLAEHAADWFDLTQESPYMLLTAQVAASRRRPVPPGTEPGLGGLHVPRSEVPAVTHVDGSARVQTVSAARHPDLHALLERFHARTGCPVLVNTSFNVRGEPIVRTPEEAYTCFMRTGLDLLVLGDHVLRKDEQPAWHEARSWRETIPWD